MRASFLWFGAKALAHSQICFVVAVGNSDFRVEFMTGRKYSDLSPDRGRLGFVECAASHARRLTPPWASIGRGGVSAWEQRVKEGTGVKPGRWIMSGADEIMVALKQHSGQQRMRDPATLWMCEICPSATEPALRVRPRRYTGEEHVCAAEPDPLMVMVAASGLSQVVAESCVVLSRIFSLRESAEVSAAQAALAGASPAKRVGFAGDSERIGHFDVPLEISLDFSLIGGGEFGRGALQFEPFMDDANGVAPSKSPYEWDSTGGSPAGCSTSTRQVDAHTAFLPHEGSDFLSSAPSTDQDDDKSAACCDNESPESTPGHGWARSVPGRR